MFTTLIVSHHLYLTKEERYLWYSGKELEIIGVNVPVWFSKGSSSEPAVEVFCKYTLGVSTHGIFMKHNEYGYELTVPQTSGKQMLLPEDIWNSLEIQEKNEWHEQNQQSPCLASLLDIKDGGAGYLAFRQFNKFKKNKKVANVIHMVEIKDMQELIDTFC